MTDNQDVKEIPINMPKDEKTIYGTKRVTSDVPNIEEIIGESFDVQMDRVRQETIKAGTPGTVIAAPRFLPPQETGIERSAVDSFMAGLRKGTTYNLLFGHKFSNIPIDPEFDASEYIRPQDQPYIAQIVQAPNLEELQRLQNYIDDRESDTAAAKYSPWMSFFGALHDPIEMGFDVATYGVGRLVALPLAYKAMRTTERGRNAIRALDRSPRLASAAEEAVLGSVTGATAVYAQENVKALSSTLERAENLGEHVFFGALIGGALGGSLGLLGKKKVDELVDKYVEANNLGRNAAHEPPPPPKTGPYQNVSTEPFVGPQPERPPVPGKNMMRMQGKEEPPTIKTKEQIKTEGEQLKASIEGEGAIARAGMFQQLRNDFMQIGENLASNPSIPAPIRKAMSLVTAPIRNMSATNRALANQYGTPRMAALVYTRNATELAGTRQGMVIPRSAQNRTEDITDWSMDMNMDQHTFWMEANGVKPGAFAAESLALADQKISQKDFFRAVSTQMLHVGKPGEMLQGASAVVQKAAKHLYEKFYKPLGEKLKDLGLIAESDLESTLNYLNRHWSTEAILNDPEGFKSWLGEFFTEQNKKHQSLRPNYDKGLDFARKLRVDAARYNRAADKIDALEVTAPKDFLEKRQKLEGSAREFLSKALEKFNGMRNTIKEKYKKGGLTLEHLTDRVVARKSVKEEIKKYRKERDALNKEFTDTKLTLNAQIKDIRNKFNEKKKSILSGSYDNKIKKEFKDANIKQIYDDPRSNALTPEDIEEYAESLIENLDSHDIKQLRKEYIAREKAEPFSEIEDLKSQLHINKIEQSELLKNNKSNLDKDINEALDLLKEEEAFHKNKANEKNKEKANEIREKLELKAVDLKEKADIAAYKKEVIRKMNEAERPVRELDRLKKKYSNAAVLAHAERKQAENVAKMMREHGRPEEQIEAFLKEARKREREAMKNAAIPAQSEAREIAESLAEGAAIELQRAEDIIPWDLRSTKTGKPYRIWNEAEEPGYANLLAEKTMYTMLGQEDEIVLNPVLTALGPGQPSMFKPRNIKMPDDYPGIERFVERDCQQLTNNFARGVAPVIALTEAMHDLNKIPLIRATVKRMQVLDPKIGPVKALMMGDEMVHYTEIPKVLASMVHEEFRIASKDLSGEALKKATKDYHDADKLMVELYKETMGIRGNGANVNHTDFSDFVDTVNSAASTVTTNNIAISMFTETMAPALRYGFPKYIATLNKLASSPEFRALNAREAKAMHRALRVGQGSILKSQITGREGSLKNSTIGRGVINLANRVGNITGANKFADLQETAMVALVKSEFLNTCENVARGTATQKELTHLAQRGVSPERANEIYGLWERYGNETDGFKGIDPGALENPSRRRAEQYAAYQAFLNDEIKTIMVRPGSGSMPSFASSPWGKMVLYLKKWFFAATNDLFIPAAQRFDAESAQGFMGLFAVGFLQSKLRQLSRPQYEEKEFNMEGAILEALTNAGFLGIYSMGLDALSTSQVINGNGGARYDPSNGITSLIVGPGVLGLTNRTLAIMGKMRQIGTNEDKQFTYKDFNYIASTAVPFWKWAPIATFAQPKIKEYFEEQGRAE